MKTPRIFRIIPPGLTLLLATITGYSQQTTAPGPQPPPTYSKSELETEQRIIKADLADANYYIDRGIKAVSAGLPEVTKVSLLRATGRLARAEEMMKDYPEHIERLSWSLFYIREDVRKQMRGDYDKLRDQMSVAEDSMYALRRDMMQKGLFGEQLKRQVAVLDAASKLLSDIEKSNPELAKKVRGLIEEINNALASGDTATAEKLIQQLNDALASGGYQQNIDEAKRKIETNAGGGSGSGGMGSGTTSASQSLAGGGTLTSGAGGLTVTSADGNSGTIQGATSLGGGRARLADGTEVDLNGSHVLPDGSIQLADGRIIKNGQVASEATPGSTGAKYVTADGQEIVIPADFSWKNGEATGIEKVYVGGKGARLIRETKVTFKPTPSPTAANTYVVQRTNGESRSWAFQVAPVPGSEKKSSGSLTLTLAISDRNGGTGFTVSNWKINSPSGSPTMGSTSGDQVTATFTASATYAIEVSGTTDWGSPFVIKANLPVGVN